MKLADRATYVRIQKIANDIGVSDRTVQRANQVLCEKEYLFIESRFKPTQHGKMRQNTNLVFVNHPCISVDYIEIPPRQNVAPSPDKLSGDPTTICHPKLTTTPIINNNKYKEQQLIEKTNFNSMASTGEKENVVVEECTREEIIKIFQQYGLKIHTAKKTISCLEKYSISTVELIAKTVTTKKQRIHNPIGLLESNPEAITESIICGRFYSEVASSKKDCKINICETTQSEYTIYVPPG
ncbi:MAG: hypothetical protein PHG06_06785 [Parabacteroides sp.]|nr:hypothetical protein [Parabacteroides sp.]